MYFRKLF